MSQFNASDETVAISVGHAVDTDVASPAGAALLGLPGTAPKLRWMLPLAARDAHSGGFRC